MKALNVIVAGGGPSGLYFAYLLKKTAPQHRIRVFEQNARDATFGFGVVLADRGLERLEAADSESAAVVRKHVYMNRDQIIYHNEESILVDRVGYGAAIGRLDLLQLLQTLCEQVGVELWFQTRFDPGSCAEADLIVGADGINSTVRTANAADFGTRMSHLTNHFAWYGTHARFECSALRFKKYQGGCFVAHYYPYSPTMGTFVAECDDATWNRLGLCSMRDQQRQRLMEEAFSDDLCGHELIYNKSSWRQFPVIANDRWSADNRVLIGDAQQSAHYSIGSGTRVALEDAVALWEVMRSTTDVRESLLQFEAARRPAKAKLLDAARQSYMWYEGFPQKLESLAPLEFVYDFMTRTGRMDNERLRREHPQFMARYEKQRAEHAVSRS
jgi:2-polyprenyl-6-methoxyphenol hydroxylase-like FAD-dependent oxidoreductase